MRHSAHGREDCEGEVQALQRSAWLAHESSYVVIPEERYKPLWVRVKSVESEDVGKATHRRVIEEDVAQGEIRRKVERCVEAGIDCEIEAGAGGSTGKGGGDGWVRVEHLSDRGQPWIKRVQFLVESVPELSSYVGKRVEPDAVETSLFGPPNGVLGEVLSDRGILLIHVGKNACEPSFGDVAAVAPGGVWIDERFEFTLRCAVIRLRAVEPIRLG